VCVRVCVCAQLTSAVAAQVRTSEETTTLLWTFLRGLFNTYKELDGSRVLVFIESNNYIQAALLFDVMVAWYAEVASGKPEFATAYRCAGVVPYMTRNDAGKATPWHLSEDGSRRTAAADAADMASTTPGSGGGRGGSTSSRSSSTYVVGAATTNETKIAGVGRLRYAMNNGCLRFHSRFHSLRSPVAPTPKAAMEAVRDKLFKQLYSFTQTVSPEGTVLFSGKANRANDDLVCALFMLVTLALADGAPSGAFTTR
jgi:hypothetical protein